MTANSRKATPLYRRNDTVLGVCEAIAQDSGIHSNLLRLAFAVGFFFSPAGALGAYLGLGVVVALVRWLVPDQVTPLADAATTADPMAEQVELKIAA